MIEQLNNIISWISLTAYYIPIMIVLCRKLWKDLPLVVFASYWAIGGIMNIMPYLVPSSVDAVATVIYNNILDVPLVMFIFYLNSTIASMRNFTRLLIPVYIFVEIMNGIFRGFSEGSFKYLMGGGVVLVIVLVMFEIVQYFQKMDHTDREKAKIFLYFAILFEYASYVIVYIFKYFIPSEPTDRNFVYYASTLFGIAISCFGFASPYLKKKPVVVAPRGHEVLISILD